MRLCLPRRRAASIGRAPLEPRLGMSTISPDRHEFEVALMP